MCGEGKKSKSTISCPIVLKGKRNPCVQLLDGSGGGGKKKKEGMTTAISLRGGEEKEICRGGKKNAWRFPDSVQEREKAGGGKKKGIYA